MVTVKDDLARIIHISDLHVAGGGAVSELAVMSDLRDTAEALRSHQADLIVVTGDLTSYGTVSKADLRLAKSRLDSLGCPVVVVPGNHDLGANHSRSVLSPDTERYEDVVFGNTHFGSVFGKSMVHVTRLGNIQIVGIALRSGDADAVLSELERAIANQIPTVVAGHYPIVQVRDTGPLPKVQPMDGWLEEGTVTRLRDMILGYNNVIAYLCGHVHASTARLIDGSVMQISAGGLGPGPSVYRLYRVQEGSLVVETHFGAGPLGFWESFGQIDGCPLEYHLGASDERSFTVELVGRGRHLPS